MLRLSTFHSSCRERLLKVVSPICPGKGRYTTSRDVYWRWVLNSWNLCGLEVCNINRSYAPNTILKPVDTQPVFSSGLWTCLKCLLRDLNQGHKRNSLSVALLGFFWSQLSGDIRLIFCFKKKISGHILWNDAVQGHSHFLSLQSV